MELTTPTFVLAIYDFNQGAGLLDKGYDDYRESAFQIEEALEGFDMQRLAHFVHSDSVKPRDVSRAIMSICRNAEAGIPPANISDVDRLDKACDAVVFAIGSMAKLGLTVDQITRAMDAVTTANLQKLSMPKDSHGKLMKPDNFEGPEAKLQLILDEREPEKC